MAQVHSNSSSSKGGTDWRDKYLDLVELQESQQRDFEQQLEQMRRTLVRVSLAVDGADPELDPVLAALREHLKSPEKHSHLHKRLAVVEEAVLSFDERKLARLTSVQQALEALWEQLRTVNSDRALAKEIKVLSGGLDTRVGNQQELPQILHDLAAVQAKILQAAEGDKPGFLHKWLSGREFSGTRSSQKDRTTLETQTTTALLHESETQEANSSATLGAELTTILDLVAASGGDSARITALQQQLHHTLNVESLRDFLHQLRQLINDALARATKEFGAFLHKTNSQLQDISQLLNHANRLARQENSQHQEFCAVMGDQLQSLRTNVAAASDLEQLKQEVSTQLDSIRARIAQAENRPDSLSEQLKDILNRVEQFEKDAYTRSKSLNQQRHKAETDSLTGLPNRDAYQQRLQLEVARWQRYNNPLSLAVLDIDHFKRINDGYGHQAGDRVLKLIAQALQKNVRETDFIGRYGGEEFVMILPETDAVGADIVLEKIRMAIAATPFHFRKQPVRITLSIGYSEFNGADTDKVVFARADKALYQAKNQGRNLCKQG